MLFRVAILLAIVGTLGVFLVQNLTPAVALVFLGIQTPALPLSWWVLGAIAAGAATTLIIRVLFDFVGFMRGPSLRASATTGTRRTGESDRASNPASGSRFGGTRTNPRQTQTRDDDAAWQDWSGYEASAARQPEPPPPPRATSSSDADDWEQPFSEDWEEPVSQPRPAAEKGRDFEAKQSPRQASQSGSVYSYSYQEPRGSGVGRTEKVVDADYRVIVPPYRPLDGPIEPPTANEPAPTEAENADDWFEETSDEFEDGPPKPKT